MRGIDESPHSVGAILLCSQIALWVILASSCIARALLLLDPLEQQLARCIVVPCGLERRRAIGRCLLGIHPKLE